MTEPGVTEFAGQLFFRLWRASNLRIAEALESIGLTPALFGVLNFIAARDGVVQREIASTMEIDPSTVVSLIDELEGAGLAERRPHPEDRRAREVAITAKGRRTVQRGRRMAMQVEDEVLGGLSASERRQLLALLRRALESAPPQSPWRGEGG